jgi:murein DD-endopeptidase MepM/ murein hydrolase activator NlpD
MEDKSPLKAGDVVVGGETQIGKIGNTGAAGTGAHLHAAASTDPMPHLAPYESLKDLFKLMDADKAKRDALKPKAEKPVATETPKAPAKKAPAKKKATK